MCTLSAALLAAAVLLSTACTSNELRPVTAPDAPPDSPPEASATVAREPRWDPRDVDDLPAAGPEVAAGLPERVSPPERAPSLAASPMEAAVLTVERGRRLQLLGLDGSWREVRPAERYGREALSPDGTRLATLLSDRIELWHLPTGERTELAVPAGYRAWDYSTVGWLDATTLLLDDHAGGWRIDIDSGASERTPYPRRFSWKADRDGVVVESTDPTRSPALIDWAGGTPRRIDLTQVEMPVGIPLRIVVSPELVTGTVYGEGELAVFTLDRENPDVVDTLPMQDFEGNYSNWALRPVHVLEDGSVLLWVAVPGPDRIDGWRLVRWEPENDLLEIVTTYDADPTWDLTFAADLIERATGLLG
jgi:hypothetical protein